MKRLTCDDPQDNFLTMMNYVFSADGWAYIRHDGKEANVPLTDWAEDQCMKHGCDEFAGECAQDIDEMLCDCLMDGEGCPVALAYCFACQAVNLRTRLKAIEDILGEEYDLDQIREAATKINEPLTLDELKEMAHQPVWVECQYFIGWAILHLAWPEIFVVAADGNTYFIWTNGEYNERLGAKLYRRPPKEESV